MTLPRDVKLVNDKLDKLKIYVDNQTDKLLLQAGKIIAVDAKKHLRYDLHHYITGNLYRSIVARLKTTEQHAVEVGSPVNYSIHVENLPDGGYLFYSAYKNWNTVQKFLKDGYKSILEKII